MARRLIFLPVFVGCSLLAANARADIDCVEAPATGDCVVNDDGSVLLSADAAERVSAAAAEATQLRVKVEAITAASDEWRKAYGLSNAAVQDLRKVAEGKDATITAQAKTIATQQAALDSWTRSPWVYVGLVVLGFAGGVVVTR